MLDKLTNRLDEEGLEDYEIAGDAGGWTVTIGDCFGEVLIDILDGSDWYHLETYNPDKDSFHYNTRRKSVDAVINYIYKHIE